MEGDESVEPKLVRYDEVTHWPLLKAGFEVLSPDDRYFMFERVGFSVEEFHQELLLSRDLEIYLLIANVGEDVGQLLGWGGLRGGDNIGYVILPDFRRRNLGDFIARKLIEMVFENGHSSLRVGIIPGNEPSVATMSRACRNLPDKVFARDYDSSSGFYNVWFKKKL